MIMHASRHTLILFRRDTENLGEISPPLRSIIAVPFHRCCHPFLQANLLGPTDSFQLTKIHADWLAYNRTSGHFVHPQLDIGGSSDGLDHTGAEIVVGGCVV